MSVDSEPKQRVLPAKNNPLLSRDTPQYSQLVEMRRLGQTNLGNSRNSDSAGLFSYVHLRAPLPQPLTGSEIFGTMTPESYFLMRRSSDGFVSSTGMFKTSFPWAKKKEEDAERLYIKDHYPRTSNEETAGNVWVHPVDALSLAEEYGMGFWIEALLDNELVLPADQRRLSITPPPPFFQPAESEAGSVAPAAALAAPISTPPTIPTPRRRSTRSTSPSKRVYVTPRKMRASRSKASKDSPLKKQIDPIIETEEITTLATTEETEEAEETEETTTEKTTLDTDATPALSNGNATESSDLTTPIKSKPHSIKVKVDESVETPEDTEVTTTRVKVELPIGSWKIPSAESTEDMIAKAKAMVAEARKLDGIDESKLDPANKRKAEDIEKDEAHDSDEEKDDARKTKRTRGLEQQLKMEKVKTRALLGLSATLAIGALLPYVL